MVPWRNILTGSGIRGVWGISGWRRDEAISIFGTDNEALLKEEECEDVVGMSFHSAGQVKDTVIVEKSSTGGQESVKAIAKLPRRAA